MNKKINLFASAEGRILIVGLVLIFLYGVSLALSCLWFPEKSQVLAAMTATHILFGRAVGMSFGYTMGLGHSVVVPVNMIIETLLVLLFYPLFVFSWQRLLVFPSLKTLMDRIHKAAETHQDKIRKYGIFGLMVFVWFPFWMTGPIVGCVIGFLLGLRTWVNLTVVLAGTYLAIGTWAFLLRELHDWAAAYHTYAPIILVCGVIIILLSARLIQGIHRRKKAR